MKKPVTPARETDEFEQAVQDYAFHSTHNLDHEEAERQVMKAQQHGKKVVVDGKELEFV